MSSSPPRRGKDEEGQPGRSARRARAPGGAPSPPDLLDRRIRNQARLEALEIRREELGIWQLKVGVGEQRVRLIKRLAFLPVWIIIALILTVNLLRNPDPVFALVTAVVLGGSAGLSSLAGKGGGGS